MDTQINALDKHMRSLLLQKETVVVINKSIIYSFTANPRWKNTDPPSYLQNLGQKTWYILREGQKYFPLSLTNTENLEKKSFLFF